jgi:hypothetical protein
MTTPKHSIAAVSDGQRKVLVALGHRGITQLTVQVGAVEASVPLTTDEVDATVAALLKIREVSVR